MGNRVVITGMGAITPVGNDILKFWENIKAGVCGIDKIDAENYFDTTDFNVDIAGMVKDFNADEYIGKKEAKRMDRFTHLAIKAGDEALEDSKLDIKTLNANRVGVIIGSGIGGNATIEEQVTNLITKGPRRVSPFYIPSSIINSVAGMLSMRYGAKGIAASVVTACASGSSAIGDAYRQIKHGYMDVMIAGGTEAAILPSSIAGFSNLKALSTTKDPKNASIPFDKNRNGFVMGEGAGIVILESLESAKKRNAKIYAEIVGYGATSDAYHITAPAPDGEGAARAMELAINEALINIQEVGYINAHGTSTPINDKTETKAIKLCFGDYANNIPISSTKGMTGHLLGAAGAIETIICAKALEDSFIPATIGLKTQDEECDLDYVPNEGRNQAIEYAMTNSLGFGGHNVSLLLRKWN
ncbi:beta-ketoacyl-ACP synthase II [uncultured Clostridium sp.]|jgi:3-oxoacyl-[acyl-carrier-protein] synthase II|uniref:beta-ketoacyl-ACP synthase II n=1 Tax=uncultured Clostridium sp. TaxID=59620 RepID=UPI002618AD50|nr:beta-ketoacyl-ACP synthase II [uncultured Clostridium sp.]